MARRTKEDAEATRNALLDAAERVFYDKGVSRASLDDIAREAGTTRGAIYWHFKDKADLFNAMMERRCASAMRCCWARIHECRSLTKSAMRLSLIRIGAEISTRPLGGLMRKYRFLMGLRVRCRWMPSISNDCSAAADRTDFGAPDFGAVD